MRNSKSDRSTRHNVITKRMSAALVVVTMMIMIMTDEMRSIMWRIDYGGGGVGGVRESTIFGVVAAAAVVEIAQKQQQAAVGDDHSANDDDDDTAPAVKNAKTTTTTPSSTAEVSSYPVKKDQRGDTSFQGGRTRRLYDDDDDYNVKYYEDDYNYHDDRITPPAMDDDEYDDRIADDDRIVSGGDRRGVFVDDYDDGVEYFDDDDAPSSREYDDDDVTTASIDLDDDGLARDVLVDEDAGTRASEGDGRSSDSERRRTGRRRGSGRGGRREWDRRQRGRRRRRPRQQDKKYQQHHQPHRLSKLSPPSPKCWQESREILRKMLRRSTRRTTDTSSTNSDDDGGGDRLLLETGSEGGIVGDYRRRKDIGATSNDKAADLCLSLTHDHQKRLAMEISRCHLSDLGKSLFVVVDDATGNSDEIGHDRTTKSTMSLERRCFDAELYDVITLSDCLHSLSDAGVHAFTHYITYIQELCIRSTHEDIMRSHDMMAKEQIEALIAAHEVTGAKSMETLWTLSNVTKQQADRMSALDMLTAKHKEQMTELANMPQQIRERVRADIADEIRSSVKDTLPEQLKEQLPEHLSKQIKEPMKNMFKQQAVEQAAFVNDIMDHLEVRDLEHKERYESWSNHQVTMFQSQVLEMEKQRRQLLEHKLLVAELDETVSHTRDGVQGLLQQHREVAATTSSSSVFGLLQSILNFTSSTTGYAWLTLVPYFFISFSVIWITTKPFMCCRRIRPYLLGILFAEVVLEILLISIHRLGFFGNNNNQNYDQQEQALLPIILERLRTWTILLECVSYVAGIIMTLAGNILPNDVEKNDGVGLALATHEIADELKMQQLAFFHQMEMRLFSKDRNVDSYGNRQLEPLQEQDIVEEQHQEKQVMTVKEQEKKVERLPTDCTETNIRPKCHDGVLRLSRPPSVEAGYSSASARLPPPSRQPHHFSPVGGTPDGVNNGRADSDFRPWKGPTSLGTPSATATAAAVLDDVDYGERDDGWTPWSRTATTAAAANKPPSPSVTTTTRAAKTVMGSDNAVVGPSDAPGASPVPDEGRAKVGAEAEGRVFDDANYQEHRDMGNDVIVIESEEEKKMEDEDMEVADQQHATKATTANLLNSGPNHKKRSLMEVSIGSVDENADTSPSKKMKGTMTTSDEDEGEEDDQNQDSS